jgi:hypothetical protein
MSLTETAHMKFKVMIVDKSEAVEVTLQSGASVQHD